MTSMPECKAAFMRLKAQAGWRDYDEGQRALLHEHLASVADNAYHAERIIEAWISTERFLPTLADLRATAAGCPTCPPAVSNRSSCSLCGGSGRESYWAVVTTHRWPNGEIRRREVQRIPATPGRENLYLVERPAEEATVDGDRQRVAMVSGYCLCEYGQHLRTIQTPVMRNEGAA